MTLPHARPAARAAIARGAVLAMLCGALAGCGDSWKLWSDNAPEVKVEVLAPSKELPNQESVAIVVKEYRPVAGVSTLELGAVHGGLMLTAYGEAPRAGWYRPRLNPRREGLPGPDGFIDYDFEAAPPELNGGAEVAGSSPAALAVRGDVEVHDSALAGAVGLRVHAESGAVAIALPRPAEGAVETARIGG